jgi:poly(3-hydroxybutyrate) depolymerase
MAGPIDVRANPNRLTRLAALSNVELHRLLTVKRVPAGYPGVGRRVYPGLLQLVGFLGMNLRSHLQKHVQFFVDVYRHEHAAAEKHRDFYDEYFTVLDMTEEYFLETLERVFFDQHLPKGRMQFEGETLRCDAITDTALMTVEGAEDDMCQVGMTAAAHDLCPALPAARRARLVQPGVGHYGVFSGSRFRQDVAPRIKRFIAAQHGALLAPVATTA